MNYDLKGLKGENLKPKQNFRKIYFKARLQKYIFRDLI